MDRDKGASNGGLLNAGCPFGRGGTSHYKFHSGGTNPVIAETNGESAERFGFRGFQGADAAL